MFSYYGPDGGVSLPQQRHCSVVHGLTPLLRGIGWGEVSDAPLFCHYDFPPIR